MAVEISLFSSFDDPHTGIPDNVLIFISGWFYTRIEVIITHSYKVATSHTEERVITSHAVGLDRRLAVTWSYLKDIRRGRNRVIVTKS
jgi:hypothetical protein